MADISPSTASGVDECAIFLHWCLPRLRMRYEGFRKVRKRLCRPLGERIAGLGLAGFPAYRVFVEKHPDEWSVIDEICRISITRFYRDQQVFAYIAREILPSLCRRMVDRRETLLRIWSAGCNAGQEPYTIRILWSSCARQYPGIALQVIGTDIDAGLLERARQARYGFSALKELPQELRARAFETSSAPEQYQLRAEYRQGVVFERQDIRRELPAGQFDLILCRNLVFTYFDEELQRQIARRIADKLVAGGYLVLGSHESVPAGLETLPLVNRTLQIYRKVA
jgi:chemotaxis protein methyltransferase CheR